MNVELDEMLQPRGHGSAFLGCSLGFTAPTQEIERLIQSWIRSKHKVINTLSFANAPLCKRHLDNHIVKVHVAATGLVFIAKHVVA